MKTEKANQPAALNVPGLHQATLDRYALDQLFKELESHAEVNDVVPKFTQRSYIPEGPLTLADARKLLVLNSARGIQIHYHFRGTGWRDTIMSAPEGFRLVRIKQD